MDLRKCLLFNLLILISFSTAHSQDFQWVDHITGASSFGFDVAVDGAGNVYVVGNYRLDGDFDPGPGVLSLGNATDQDVFFGKYSNTGQLIWAKALHGTDKETGLGIALDNQSNIYITGSFVSSTLDFDPGSGTAILNSGSGSEIFVAKYDNSGNYQWAFNIGGNGSGSGRDIEVDNSGNVYVSGDFDQQGSTLVDFDPDPLGQTLLNDITGRAFFAKYDTNGNIIWAFNVGATMLPEDATCIAVDAARNVYITGAFGGTSDFNPSGTSTFYSSVNGGAYVAKYNSNGNYLWAKQVPGQGGEGGTGIEVDGSGNVFIVGQTSLTVAGDVFLRKYDSSGDLQWAADIETTNFAQAGKLALDGSSNAYITGLFSGTNIDFNPLGTAVNLSGGDMFLAKYGTNGILDWVRNVASTSGVFSQSVATNSSDVFVIGSFNGTADFNPCRGNATLAATGNNAFFGKYSQSSLLPTTINGPDEVCSSGGFTFTLDKVPPGATVFWTTSPSNLLSPSSAIGSTFSTNAVGSGTVTITANVDNGAGCDNAVISKQSIRVGAFSVSEVSVTGTSMVCPGNVYYYNAIVPGGHKPGYTYSWTYPSNWTVPSFVTTAPQIGLQVPTYNPAYGTVRVSVNNGCGPSPFDGLTVFEGFGCGGYFTFSPNPADNVISLSSTAINQRSFEQSTTTEEAEEYVIELYDGSGNRVEHIKTKSQEIDVPTDKLRDGLYSLKIHYMKEVIEHSIIIKH